MTTPYADILLNPLIAYGSGGDDVWHTEVARSQNGMSEQRNQLVDEPYGMWMINLNHLDDDEYTDLENFANARKGNAVSFRFLAWPNYTMVAEDIGSLSGAPSETIQITYDYTSGGETTTKTITKPVDTSDSNHTLNLTDYAYQDMTVTIGGVAKTEGVDYSVDYETGLITDLVGVAGTVLVSCSFHRHVRFDFPERREGLNPVFEAFNTTNVRIPIIELLYA